MLRIVDHGPVREIEMSTRTSRAAGYKVSAFVYRGILIDSGFPRIGAGLARYLEANPVAGAIITHWHEDHAGNLDLLVQSGIRVSVSAATLAAHRALPRVPFYRWLVWGHPRIATTDPDPASHPFEIVPVPGHTPDHVAVWDPDARVVFTGDLFLGVRAAVSHHYESPEQILASVRRVIALRPRQLFDAHRGLVSKPVEALTAKAEWLEKTIVSVRAAIAEGRTDRAIVSRVLGGEDRIALISRGEMAKRNFVAAIRAS